MLASRKPRRRRALLAPSALLLCAGVLGARLLLASSSSPRRRLVEHPTGGESFSLVTWLIAASMAGEPYVAGGGDVMEPLLILFGYLVMFIVIVAAFGWRLTPGMG